MLGLRIDQGILMKLNLKRSKVTLKVYFLGGGIFLNCPELIDFFVYFSINDISIILFEKTSSMSEKLK